MSDVPGAAPDVLISVSLEISHSYIDSYPNWTNNRHSKYCSSPKNTACGPNFGRLLFFSSDVVFGQLFY